jgi:hypothetical protein
MNCGTLEGSRAPRDGTGPAKPDRWLWKFGTLEGSRAPRDGTGPAKPDRSPRGSATFGRVRL